MERFRVVKSFLFLILFLPVLVMGDNIIDTIIENITKDDNKKISGTTHGFKNGECKTYLNHQFIKIKKALPSLKNYYQLNINDNSDIEEIETYRQTDKDKDNKTLIKELLLKIKRGDILQMKWNPNLKKRIAYPHTVIFTKDYSDGKNLFWADSNLDSDYTVHIGDKYPWGINKTLDSMYNYLSTYCINNKVSDCGATLYRLKDTTLVDSTTKSETINTFEPITWTDKNWDNLEESIIKSDKTPNENGDTITVNSGDKFTKIWELTLDEGLTTSDFSVDCGKDYSPKNGTVSLKDESTNIYQFKVDITVPNTFASDTTVQCDFKQKESILTSEPSFNLLKAKAKAKTTISEEIEKEEEKQKDSNPIPKSTVDLIDCTNQYVKFLDGKDIGDYKYGEVSDTSYEKYQYIYPEEYNQETKYESSIEYIKNKCYLSPKQPQWYNPNNLISREEFLKIVMQSYFYNKIDLSETDNLRDLLVSTKQDSTESGHNFSDVEGEPRLLKKGDNCYRNDICKEEPCYKETIEDKIVKRKFNNLTASTWAVNYIKIAGNENIISEEGKQCFNPTNHINLVEGLKIIFKSNKVNHNQDIQKLIDLKEENPNKLSWSLPYLIYLSDVLEDDSDWTQPDEKIKRDYMAYLIKNIEEYPNKAQLANNISNRVTKIPVLFKEVNSLPLREKPQQDANKIIDININTDKIKSEIYIIKKVKDSSNDGKPHNDWYLVLDINSNKIGYITSYYFKDKESINTGLRSDKIVTLESTKETIYLTTEKVDNIIALTESLNSNTNNLKKRVRTVNSNNSIIDKFNTIIDGLDGLVEPINQLKIDINNTVTDINQTSILLGLLDDASNKVDSIKSMTIKYRDDNVTELQVASDNIVSSLYELRAIFVGDDDNSDELTYGLNDIEITNDSIVSKIKDTIDELETIQGELDDLTSFDGDELKQQYDGLKSRLDDAKSKMDAIKQSIDNNIEDNDEKVGYKAEADKIKKAIDDVKKLIDGYKKDADNSPKAIADINGAIDGVIGMMRSGEQSDDGVETTSISIKQGRNTISGNIDITTLPDEVHSIWIVDGGNWYGYSPYPQINDEIDAKYSLITENIRNYKGALVYAVKDCKIETVVATSDESVEHTYPRGFSIHGTDGTDMSADDVVCDEPSKVVMVAKVSGDEASVYVPEREIEGMENFVYLGETDGYYVLCDK